MMTSPASRDWCRDMAAAMRQSGMDLTEPVWPSHFLCSLRKPLPEVLQCLEEKHRMLLVYIKSIPAAIPPSARLFSTPLTSSALLLAAETTPAAATNKSWSEEQLNRLLERKVGTDIKIALPWMTTMAQEKLYGTQPASPILAGMYEYLSQENWFQVASDKLLLAKWRMVCSRSLPSHNKDRAPSPDSPSTITPHGGRWYAWAISSAHATFWAGRRY